MGVGIGFAIILIVLGVFLPEILSALTELILIIIEKAIMHVNAL